MTAGGDPIQLLLVEDNEADIRLTEIALGKANFESVLRVVRDGEEALDYLNKRGRFESVARPDLVLLDLNLPKVNGIEVLKDIRGSETLKDLPVVMLTTSDAERDIFESYELNVNCYVTKPVDLKKFMGVIEMIEDFWTQSPPEA